MGMQLTEKQQRALQFIQSEISDRGRPPTLREIGSHIGVSSTNGVRYVLDALVRKGYLERSPMLSRGIELTDRSVRPNPKSDVREIPILGRIAAGIPITATENHEGRISVDKSIAPTAIPPTILPTSPRAFRSLIIGIAAPGAPRPHVATVPIAWAGRAGPMLP